MDGFRKKLVYIVYGEFVMRCGELKCLWRSENVAEGCGNVRGDAVFVSYLHRKKKGSFPLLLNTFVGFGKGKKGNYP